MVTMISFSLVVSVLGTMAVTTFVYLRSLKKPKHDSLPKLVYKRSTLAMFLLERCSGLKRPFEPSFWTKNRHVQTIMAAFYPGPKVEFVREYLQMKDRGVIALDWVKPSQGQLKMKMTSPVLIILPGMTGDALSVSAMCLEGSREGYRVVVFNKRGHGGSVLTTPMLQGFGDPSDLRQVVKFARGRYPYAELTGVGFSAGSGLLVSYLGEFGSSAYLSAAVCISPGYDAWRLFTHQRSRFYDFCLLYGLKNLLCKHSAALSKAVDIKTAMKAKTIREFDEAVYCKLHGHSSLKDYWDKNNPMREIDEVTVPVLCISSLDDPICVKENIPFDLFTAYPNFFLVATEKGGHCGFMEGIFPRPWANALAVEYLSTVLNFWATSDAI